MLTLIKGSVSKSSAEDRFRGAFERLKLGNPELLPKGTPVSQNNVAKEAGCDPSALRKARFPTLVSEIQHWVDTHKEDRQPSVRQMALKRQKLKRADRETIKDLKLQRDVAVGLLADANLRIVELTEELAISILQLKKLKPSAGVLALIQP